MRIQLSDHFSYSKLLRFTFPPIVTMVFTSLYGVVDGLFVTNFVGKSALAALNFVYPLLNILAIFGYMVGAGGSALVAKTLGEGNKEKANKLFSMFVYGCTLLGVLLAVIGFFTLRPMLSLFGAEGVMLEQAVLYGNILLVSLAFWNLQFLFQIFFITAEKPKLGLYVTLLAGFANMVLDALFIAVFKWGLAGAAAATGLSQIIAGGIPLIYFGCKNSSLLKLGRAKFDIEALLKGTSNGMSEFVSGVSSSLVGILYNTQLMKYAGEDGVAAYSIMMYAAFIFIGIFAGYANGAAPVIGYHFGAKNHTELKSLLKKSVILNVVASFAMLVLSEFLAIPLSRIFAGYDPGLYAMTLKGFRIYAVSFLFSGMAIFGSSFFTALNNGAVSATISFMRTIVFQVACVILLPLIWKIDGIWYSIAVSEALAVVVSVIFLIVMRKKYKY